LIGVTSHGMDAEKSIYFTNSDGDKINSSWLFDWGRKYFHPDILSSLWRNRQNHWKSLGLKIEDEFNIIPDRGCTTTDEFLAKLHNVTSINDGEVPIWAFDLHSMVFYLARDLSDDRGKPIHVIHFDTHHDLGYSDYANIQQQIEKCKFEYGSWLFHAIHIGYVGSVEIVYPDWRGMNEWKNCKEAHIHQISDKIEVFTWKKWKEKNVFYDDVGFVGVAKSTPWTPPWLDKQFLDFVQDLSWCHHEAHDICLDCENPDTSRPFDACKIRDWELGGEAACPSTISVPDSNTTEDCPALRETW
jgi:hypothetical protein